MSETLIFERSLNLQVNRSTWNGGCVIVSKTTLTPFDRLLQDTVFGVMTRRSDSDKTQ